MTGQGFEVLSAAGTPIQVMAGLGPLVIDGTGLVSQNGTQLGRLAVRTFADPGQLLPLAAGVFAAPPEMDAKPVAKPEVLQANLEASNLTSLHEMVDLVTISRASEANQKVITSRDDLMEKTLQAFG